MRYATQTACATGSGSAHAVDLQLAMGAITSSSTAACNAPSNKGEGVAVRVRWIRLPFAYEGFFRAAVRAHKLHGFLDQSSKPWQHKSSLCTLHALCGHQQLSLLKRYAAMSDRITYDVSFEQGQLVVPVECVYRLVLQYQFEKQIKKSMQSEFVQCCSESRNSTSHANNGRKQKKLYSLTREPYLPTVTVTARGYNPLVGYCLSCCTVKAFHLL